MLIFRADFTIFVWKSGELGTISCARSFKPVSGKARKNHSYSSIFLDYNISVQTESKLYIDRKVIPAWAIVTAWSLFCVATNILAPPTVHDGSPWSLSTLRPASLQPYCPLPSSLNRPSCANTAIQPAGRLAPANLMHARHKKLP